MRYAIIALMALLGVPLPAQAEIGISIGINVPIYPQLTRIPGYPVYYAPQLAINLFFYDGLYWAYARDGWYVSSWYNGPWSLVGPQFVPVYLLRVPVRYYRAPPPYFYGWPKDAPPKWGKHWGEPWQHERAGWDEWNRGWVPPPAPLPVYQRSYQGDRYPQESRQGEIRRQYYGYQPGDPDARRYYADSARPAMPPGQAKGHGGQKGSKGGKHHGDDGDQGD